MLREKERPQFLPLGRAALCRGDDNNLRNRLRLGDDGRFDVRQITVVDADVVDPPAKPAFRTVAAADP